MLGKEIRKWFCDKFADKIFSQAYNEEEMKIIHYNCQNGEGNASYSLKTGRNLICVFNIMMTIGRFVDAVQSLDMFLF